ncbi:MAG TPA: hypothetical protein VF040_00045 [Ktedonobacterales bacterium]
MDIPGALAAIISDNRSGHAPLYRCASQKMCQSSRTVRETTTDISAAGLPLLA